MASDFTMLDTVIEKTIQSVENSQHQIFEIAEQAREECENLKNEIEKVKEEVLEIIKMSDLLGGKLRSARHHLSEVSRNFQRFNEEDIRKAYEEANKLQIEHSLLEEKEKQLRSRRDDLQLRLRKLEQTVERAENLMTQMGVVLGYLSGEIKEVGQMIEDVKHQQQMGLKIIQAQEEERKRVAREIHDGPAQSMANVVLRTDLVEKVLSQEGIEKAKIELKELKGMLRESIADVRRIIFDLRPMALDDLGLVPTLNKYIEVLSKQAPVGIEFKTFGKELRLPSLIEVAIFRLVQETLTNVMKHSKAKRCIIKLEFQKDRIYIIISDDGIGFNTKEKSKVGFGLLGMKERMKLLEGQIIVQSSLGQGTKLLITIPNKSELA